MNLFTKLKHSLLGRPQPRVTQVAPPDASGMRIDELPPFSVQTADLMRFDPQVRIGLGARNGLMMAAEVEVDGEPRVRQWVQHQWDALWHAAAHQLLRAKLYGFQAFEVVYRQRRGGPLGGLSEVERLIDYPPSEVRLLMSGEEVVGFRYESSGVAVGRAANADQSAGVAYGTPSHPDAPRSLFAPRSLVCTFDAECGNPYGCALLARAY